MGSKQRDSSLQGCGAIVIGFILTSIIYFSCDCDRTVCRSNSNNSSDIPTEDEILYPMKGDDPINWRKEEEKLENRIPNLKNAPYACKRCGMKSDRPLDDPDGIWGRNGVCAYCIDYLRSKR